MQFLVFVSLLTLASAHVELWYPPWRNDSFNPPFDQQIYPCAGISDTADVTVTPWPLDGGSLNITLRDAAAIVFVNLGLGTNVTNFNITLLAQPLNETGAGNLCIPKLSLPAGFNVTDGTRASIQVATSNPKNGEGLYNCADIVFSSNASLLASNQCVNSTTITVNPLFSSSSTNSSSNSSASGSGGSKSDASSVLRTANLGATICFALFISRLITYLL